MISRILLINSPRVSNIDLSADTGKAKNYYEVYPPLGLLYLSSMIKRELENIQIEVLDLHLESIKDALGGKTVNWFEMCRRKIEEFQPDLVGLTVIFGASFAYAKSIGTKIKDKYPKIIIVGGGIHITSIAKEKNKLAFCDFISLYESEYHFLGLIKYLNNQQNFLRGIIVNNKFLLRNEADVLSDIERPDNLDNLPIPDFATIDLKNYYKYGILSAAQTISYETPVATLLTSRGCLGNCKFCSVRSFMGPGVRTHSPERVLSEIDILYKEFGIRHIDVVDDDFAYNGQRVIDILNGLIDRKYSLTWSMGNGIRIGSLNEKIMKKMVKSGCTYFSIGIESGDQSILKEMRKPLTIELLKKKVKLLHKYPEIYYRANFMIGFPGETLEQMEKTFSLAEEIALDWSLFSICKPLPNTDLFNEMLNNSSDFNSDLIDYRFDSSKGMPIYDNKEEFIFDLAYTNNLKINFKNNVNLMGRNIKRSVKDFDRIVKLAKDHAFSWNCLAIGYKALNMKEEKKFAIKKTNEIVKRSAYWRQKFEELDFAIVC
ncbi:B12-binding domain-containing radical SAM protein [bacterium]|nr:B12-binding domain-containing radical SAM protein [bacterium]